MKISTASLIEAITHRSIYLSGDENGGVALRCRDHHDGGRPLAHYDSAGDTYPDPDVATFTTIPALLATAADHLATQHREPHADG